jgi:hypothetical protein
MLDIKATNHTGRELELMLSGRKPLAMFFDEVSFLPDEEIIPEESFRPFVESGQVVRGEVTTEGEFHPKLGRNVLVRYVLFALAAEAWRIPAMALFLRVRGQSNVFGSEGFERIECALLGYTKEETDAWCEHRFGRSSSL